VLQGSPKDSNVPNLFQKDLIPIEQIHELDELSDGSRIYEIGAQQDSGEEDDSEPESIFYRNLANKMKPDKLQSLAARLLDEIKEDKESRAEWEKTINVAMQYLGFKVEEFRNVPFFRACAAFDSTLATALFHFYSTARAELFPAAGPARSEIIGVPTEEIEDQGERVKIFMNYYLTQKDEDYYPDSERLLIYVGLFGCAFRKVYQDPVLNRPTARLIRPQDLIINHHTTSVATSDRISEVLYLNRKEVLLRQRCDDFIDFELPKLSEDDEDESRITKSINKIEGVEKKSHQNKSLFKFYEVHVNLDADEVEPKKSGKGDDIPRPYIVTICEATRKAVSVKRNWKEGDDKYERLKYYVHYYYLPGFGIYSLGLAHLTGSNAITLTSILRQLIDAGTLKNFPGGLKMRGMSIENNDKAIGPSEWLEVETGGMPISECLMPMPYSEPSTVLLQLREQLKQETSNLVSTAEKEIPEIGANMPVGTTLALLEVANKVQSSILRSLHAALGTELKLLFKLFGEYLENEPYPFAVPGKEVAIMGKDFNDKVNIVPVSDPNVLTSTHRLMRNQALLQLAQSNPAIHDMREAYRRMYSAMDVENIDALLPKPEQFVLDANAENMLILLGRDVDVKIFQDDESHILVHHHFSQNPLLMGNPQLYAKLMLHIQKHKCFKAFKDMQKQQHMQQLQQRMQPFVMAMQAQGMAPETIQGNVQQAMEEEMNKIPLPQLSDKDAEGLIKDPQIQNTVSKQDAQSAQQEQQQAEQQKATQIDATKAMVMDIEQHREAANLKHEDAKMKTEADAFKAQLKYEAEMAKTESQIEIAKDKHEVELAKLGPIPVGE
jgi:hypothetical protein